jgi:hypothetical protein
MRIFIVGAERSGKSTAALYLSEALYCKFAETGDLVIDELAKLYSLGNGLHQKTETWARIIGLHKEDFRPELGVIGDLITRIRPSALIDACPRRARIVVGVRRKREVFGCYERRSRRGWNSLWIKIVSNRPPVSASRYELQDHPCDGEIVNDGDLSALQSKMYELARIIQSSSFR